MAVSWQIEEYFRPQAHHGGAFGHSLDQAPGLAPLAICFAAFAMLRILRRLYNTEFGADALLSEGTELD